MPHVKAAEGKTGESSSRFGFKLDAMRAAASDALKSAADRAASSAASARDWSNHAASELSARASAARERLDRDPAAAGGASAPASLYASLTPTQREAAFSALLQQPTVPHAALCQFCLLDGVPEGVASTPRLRALAWKVLLGYLPHDRSEWAVHLKTKRELYAAWRVELTTDPYADQAAEEASGSGTSANPATTGGGSNSSGGGGGGSGSGGGGGGRVGDAEAEGPLGASSLATDHPLNPSNGSSWREWHADEELRAEIKKDVDRTLRARFHKDINKYTIYICIYISIYLYVSMYVSIHLSIYLSIYIYIYIYRYIGLTRNINKYMYISIHMYMLYTYIHHTYRYIYIYMYVSIYLSIYLSIYIFVSTNLSIYLSINRSIDRSIV